MTFIASPLKLVSHLLFAAGTSYSNSLARFLSSVSNSGVCGLSDRLLSQSECSVAVGVEETAIGAAPEDVDVLDDPNENSGTVKTG